MSRLWIFSLFLCLLGNSDCSLKKKAVNTLADVLGKAETVYLSDDDPELVEAALPFNLKTIETLLQSSPNHRGLLLTATKGFVFYTYGFVEPEADRVEEDDFYRALEIRKRASRLYSRAFHYGLRGLEVRHPGISSRLSRSPTEASSALDREDVPLAVWTAASLGLLVGVSLDDPEKTADIAVVGALLERALELDPTYDDGTIHEFLVLYESEAVGGSTERARDHFQQALQLSGGKRCSIWLTWAESISVSAQDRAEFDQLVDKAWNCDLKSTPANLLLNTLAQRRARWLKAHEGDLFLENGGDHHEQ